MLSAGVAWRLPPVRPPALPLGSSPVCGVVCCAACCVVYTRSVVGFMWLGFVLTNLVVGSHGCFVRVGCGVSLTPLVQLHNALSDRYGLATEQISKEISGCQDPVKILRCCPSATLANPPALPVFDRVLAVTCWLELSFHTAYLFAVWGVCDPPFLVGPGWSL